MNFIRLARLIPTLLLVAGCPSDDLIRNPLVDRWCGDRPCEWEPLGKIERVGTWHKEDIAVSFESNHAQISQLNATADTSRAECFAFTMLAKVSHDTKMYLEMDFLDDTKIDFSQRIPEGNWVRRTFLVTTPTWYKGVRFIIRKDGPGDARLAQLSAQVSDSCTKPPLNLDDRPPGASCEDSTQCSDTTCVDGYCGACDAGVDGGSCE